MALADYIGKYWTGAEAIYGVIIVMTFTSVLRGNPVFFKQMLSTTIYSTLHAASPGVSPRCFVFQ